RCPYSRDTFLYRGHGSKVVRRGIFEIQNPPAVTVNEFHRSNIGVKVLRCARLLAQKLVTLAASEDIVPFVDRFGADHKLRHVAQGVAGLFNDEMPVYDV